MRLTDKEISAIQTNILHFDPEAQIYLFGSRLNDLAKGGDIDVLVISKTIGFIEKVKIRTGIFEEIEEQKLDIVVKKNFNDLFVKMIQPDLQCL